MADLEPDATVISPVIGRMQAIAAALGHSDGVWSFNHLYLRVTLSVAAHLKTQAFEDPAFLARLDVVFADRYFAAVDAVQADRAPSSAWTPLFEERGRAGVAPIQFALAGMNAHINYDLAQALDQVAGETGLSLERDSPQRRDYERVNGILDAVEQEVKGEFETGPVGEAARDLGRTADVVATWSVAHAREAAWTHAEILASLDPLPGLRAHYLEVLGGLVELSSRGLLVPTV